MVKSRSVIATPPGATIKEQLLDRGMKQKEFSVRMGMSEKHISRLINGDVQLTSDVAMRLEMVLGIPAQFWSNLESIYRDKLVRACAENEMDADIEFAYKLPYKEMAQNGWVPAAKTPQEKVINLRKYFEVVQLGILTDGLIPGIVCRRLGTTEKSDFSLIAWAQKARLIAREIDTMPIDLKGLTAALPQMRKMTMMDLEEFFLELRTLLSSCGVALVFLPHIGGSFLHGATFYSGNKIVMGLTVRGKDADKFWFSFFHELGHILLGHIGKTNGTMPEEELAADSFAKQVLIPLDQFNAFVDADDFSREAIMHFAHHIEIDVGIVVGRLQKENYIRYTWHNDLKSRYDIAEFD